MDILVIFIKILLLPLYTLMVSVKYLVKALRDIFDSSYKFLMSE